MGMSEFICPLVEVPVGPRRVEHDDELHKESRSRHVLRLLVQQCKDVALIVRDQAKSSTQQGLASQDQKEMGENQGAKHLQCSNPSSRVTILMGPMMIFQWHPVMEPPCVFLRRVFFVRDPSPNVSPNHWVRTSITSSPPVGSGVVWTRLYLGMV